jgi:ribonuclease-3
MSKTSNSNTSALEKAIGYEFKQKVLLDRALVHRSYLNENNSDQSVRNNERLEFLGDAVLELIVTEYLFDNYPSRPEGELTSFRAAVVRTESLAETAMQLQLGDFIKMSKGEEATGGRTRPYILANTFEALLGALYLDSNFKVCREFVTKKLLPKLEKIIELRLDIDPKSKLQEITQERYKFTPIYEVIKQEGPDHERVFTVQVIVNDNVFGTGAGKSKQEAEQRAAEHALDDIDNWDSKNTK